MINLLKKLVSAVLILTLAFSVTACGLNVFDRNDLMYDEFPTDYDPDIDSWLQIDPDDVDVEINWFVNYPYKDYIKDLIFKRTGVKINYQIALTSDNQELNTMIAGNDLPDVITISDMSTRVQLAEEGYVYAIDGLAKSYAPSLQKRLPKEHLDYYAASDGHTYGIASNFYNDQDIKEFQNDLNANQYMNYDVLVRKDYLNEFISYKKNQNPAFNADTYITRPAGFIEMVSWVKQEKGLLNSNPTIMLDSFMQLAVNDSINYSLSALMEFFAVPYEDSDGNLVFQQDTPEFVKVIEFLNELYRNNLITSGNFSFNSSDIGSHILNGRPVAIIGASHNHGNYLANREIAGYNKTTGIVADSHKYVSIVLTNENGDAPILLDYAGRGMHFTMVTKSCKRVDRVIKVMDYLLSEQGQREVCYGEVEGEFYNYLVKPGAINPDTQNVSTHGVIEWTDKAKNLLKDNNITALRESGFTIRTMLSNILYTRMTSGSDNYVGMTTLRDYIEYQNKSTYFDYSISRVPFRYPLATKDIIKINKHIDTQFDIESIWIEALPRIIMASSKNNMMEIYNKAISDSYAIGAEQWLELKNTSFNEFKDYLNIDYGWPKANPNYVQPAVTLFGTSEKYKLNKPDYITWN